MKKTNPKIIKILIFALLLTFGSISHLLSEKAIKIDNSTMLTIEGLVRSYFINDQRLQWSGMEITFGAESILELTLEKEINKNKISLHTEVFLNQPFNKNILAEGRQNYLQNFEVEPVALKQLYIQYTGKNFCLGLGKHPTVFGKNHSIPFTNSFFDYPFIRNEAIVNYETGFFFKYLPGIFRFDIAIVNGCENMDTNSSKAGIARIGIETKNLKTGLSIKAQDGIGSEWQKQYNNHVGFDLALTMGNFIISAEIIYDQYGFHKEFDINDVFWGRSYYYRDIFYQYKTPVKGLGGYLDIQYKTKNFFLELNYGEYYPQKINILLHDDPIKRLIVKSRINLTKDLFIYALGLFENKRDKESLFKGASDYGFLFGLWYSL